MVKYVIMSVCSFCICGVVGATKCDDDDEGEELFYIKSSELAQAINLALLPPLLPR